MGRVFQTIATRRHGIRLHPWMALLLVPAWPLLAVLAPVNHDESQYLAAAALTGDALRPFADYLYLQSPLQPFVTAPLAKLAAPYSFVALRLFTAALGLGTLALIYSCGVAAGVRRHVALSAAVLLAATYSFQFGTTVFRNDALPALLMAAAMLHAIRGAGRDSDAAAGEWLRAGLLAACAGAAKISYLLPAAAIGGFLLLRLVAERRGWRDLALCALGAAPVALLVAWVRAQAPESFDYGVFGYALEEPYQFYRAVGQAAELGVGEKLSDTFRVLMTGPAWIALLIVGWQRVAKHRCWRVDTALLLDLLIVAGAGAALLPTPTYKQYAIPLLLPLFVRMGLSWRSLPGRQHGWGLAIRALVLAAAIPGAVVPLLSIKGAIKGKPNPISLTRQAHWIGERLAYHRVAGRIATLSPQAVLDSGYDLDPRFATGPFFYRSGDDEPDDFQHQLNVVSPRTLDRFFAAEPPAAIVTGYETRSDAFGADLDRAMRTFAIRHGYRLERSPFERALLYIAPREARSAYANVSGSQIPAYHS